MRSIFAFVMLLQSAIGFACPDLNSVYSSVDQTLQIDTNTSPTGIKTYLLSALGSPNVAVYIADGLTRVLPSGQTTQTVTCDMQIFTVKEDTTSAQPDPECGNALGSRYLTYIKFTKVDRQLRRNASTFHNCSNGHEVRRNHWETYFNEY